MYRQFKVYAGCANKSNIDRVQRYDCGRRHRYNSASEVAREALRLPEEQDDLKSTRKEEFRKKIAEGLESLARGEGVDGEEVFARIEGELDELERSGHA